MTSEALSPETTVTQERAAPVWMPAAIRPGAGGEPRVTEYYYCDNFPARGPLVVLLARRSWPAQMRMHQGILRQAFFSREATPDEPDRAVGGIPWNWCYRLDQLFLDEERLRSPQDLARLRDALERELAAVQAEGALRAATPEGVAA